MLKDVSHRPDPTVPDIAFAVVSGARTARMKKTRREASRRVQLLNSLVQALRTPCAEP
jgi:hypothetical protein